MLRTIVVACMVAFSTAMPVQLTVNQRGTECMYEQLNEKESVTMSVFILSGPELKATVKFEGPLTKGSVDSGAELQKAVAGFDRGVHPARKQTLKISETVDFEHLNLGEDDDFEEDEDDEYRSGEETAQARMERRAKERKRALEARQRREQQRIQQRKYVRAEGEPFQKTVKAPLAGWYRFCVVGTWYQVTAEIDLRKESEFGGLDQNGHVRTLSQKLVADEDKLMEEATAAEEGIKDEDFKSTRDKLKKLRRLLADIQSKQSQERHRLIVHAATNEHSHSHMVLMSLLETVLFMAVTGFQVYTIRKWFRGAPVLGR